MGRVRRSWTPQEDALLRRAVNDVSANSRPLLWRELAKSVPGRTNKDCRRRWWNSLTDGTAKGPWSEDEDAKFIEAVQKYGTNWSKVGRAVASRNSDQCSSHWVQVLDPEINHCDWTTQEVVSLRPASSFAPSRLLVDVFQDDHLLHAVLTHGTNWTTVAASHMTRRATLALKNRYSTLRMRHENSAKNKFSATGKTPTLVTSGSRCVEKTSTSGIEASQGSRGGPGDSRDDDEDGNDDDEEDEEEGGEGDDDDDDDEDQDDCHGQAQDQRDTSARDTVLDASPRPMRAVSYGHQNDGSMPLSTALSGWPEQNVSLAPRTFPCGASPLSFDSWTNHNIAGAPYHSPYILDQPSLSTVHGGDFLNTMQHSGELRTSASYTPFAGIGMDAANSVSSSYPTMTTPATTPSVSGNLMEARAPESSGAVRASATPKPGFSMTYQVSISMTCTGTQLEAVLAGLTGAGTGVEMKVQPRS